MDKDKLANILKAIAEGNLTVDNALESLQNLPYENLDFAKIDLHRQLRQGIPEVIFCPGKTCEQIVKIAQTLSQNHSVVIATRATEDIAERVMPLLPGATYDPLSKAIIIGTIDNHTKDHGCVALITAGTADIAVAEEAAIILKANGIPTNKIYDVGVAGIHRLFDHLEIINNADVVIVVAGMDGALPSVVGGLVKCPVIAVPTSVGYGANFGGLSALLSMLNSCASGITVVNIDNGFGAAVAALRILKSIEDLALRLEQAPQMMQPVQNQDIVQCSPPSPLVYPS